VLKQLGVDANDDGFGGDKRLALLDDELPDWTAFIAANLLVDGVLTTFVASCVDSALEPMAARARKILQEEGSHRAHGEAWARRLLRGSDRDAFVERLRETWEHAGRWVGPDDDAELSAALEAGEVSRDAAAQRELVRTWLVDLLAAEGVALELPQLTWDGWDADRRRWSP
jgi:1,2-phenylacetyl-CoA epoxidase catalytic subunit